ncbi:MAG: Hsp20/alpha crystallin family protein [Bryobacteraceae bacterium]|nr:Hsp20/alpha crystallin family protein [Bryobacteraceae bacterium]
MRHLQDAVSRFLNEPGMRPWTPPVDILETGDELLMKMDVPDITLKDVEIRLENDTLTIRGERKFEQPQSKGYHRIERSYGTFARSFALPNTVDTEKVKADYRNGVLTLTLPKKEVAKPRTIQVEINQ